MFSSPYDTTGFEAFSTVGYGEFTPKTPAGRSVFIVWALLGVGNMTILISGKLYRSSLNSRFTQSEPHDYVVLSEAYSSRYRAALNGNVNGHGAQHSSDGTHIIGHGNGRFSRMDSVNESDGATLIGTGSSVGLNYSETHGGSGNDGIRSETAGTGTPVYAAQGYTEESVQTHNPEG